MSERDQELLRLFHEQTLLRVRGYTFESGADGGVAVARAGHLRGVWHFDGKDYCWTPPGYMQPTYRAHDAEAALRYTVVVLVSPR